jgi:hypothetical protein
MTFLKILFAAMLATSFAVHAKVFDFKSESFAPYIKGTIGYTAVGQKGYEFASGANTEFASTPLTNFSGEFGFLVSFANSVGLRLFLDVIQVGQMKEIPGKNAAGTITYMNLTSSIVTYSPSVALEVYLLKTTTSRMFFYGGMGLAQTTLTNSYKVSAAGQSAYTLTAEYTEKASTNAMNSFAGVGYELLMSDTATIALDAGYRYLPIAKLTHDEAGTTIAQGAVAKGDTLKDSNGDTRTFDLSTLYTGISFRIYIQ